MCCAKTKNDFLWNAFMFAQQWFRNIRQSGTIKSARFWTYQIWANISRVLFKWCVLTDLGLWCDFFNQPLVVCVVVVCICAVITWFVCLEDVLGQWKWKRHKAQTHSCLCMAWRPPMTPIKAVPVDMSWKSSFFGQASDQVSKWFVAAAKWRTCAERRRHPVGRPDSAIPLWTGWHFAVDEPLRTCVAYRCASA